MGEIMPAASEWQTGEPPKDRPILAIYLDGITTVQWQEWDGESGGRQGGWKTKAGWYYWKAPIQWAPINMPAGGKT